MNPTDFNWNDFVDLYDWEFNLICAAQAKDVNFWLTMANMYKGNILEFGCGTGRISLELAKNGFQITAVDLAKKFIEKLNSKNKYKNLKSIIGNMIDFKSLEKFELIIFPYSTFQYLLSDEDCLSCLKNTKNLLTESGKIILDISPHIAQGSNLNQKIKLYSDFNNELNCHISMFTSYYIENGIQSWEDEYLIKHYDGSERKFIHKLALKKFEMNNFKLLCKKSNLTIDNIYGSFSLDKQSEESSNYLIVLSIDNFNRKN